MNLEEQVLRRPETTDRRRIPPLPDPPLLPSGPERPPLAAPSAPGLHTLHPDACRRSCTAAADPHLELQGQPPEQNLNNGLLSFLPQDFGRAGILDKLTWDGKKQRVRKQSQTGSISEVTSRRTWSHLAVGPDRVQDSPGLEVPNQRGRPARSR